MRPFAQLAFEMISMARAGIRGVALREWEHTNAMMHHSGKPPETRTALLEVWDATTAEIDRYWPQIPPQRFEEVDNAFGTYEGVIYGLLWYWIDNEIHHRGQGYVYLRALGIEPPPFYDRSSARCVRDARRIDLCRARDRPEGSADFAIARIRTLGIAVTLPEHAAARKQRNPSDTGRESRRKPIQQALISPLVSSHLPRLRRGLGFLASRNLRVCGICGFIAAALRPSA